MTSYHRSIPILSPRMKLIRFGTHDHEKPGVILDDGRRIGVSACRRVGVSACRRLGLIITSSFFGGGGMMIQ